MTGFHLSQYRIDSELGRGGMGIVYKATDTKLNRTVALKILPASALASDDDRARFFREAQAAAQLHHPNIATVFQIDEAIPVDDEGAQVQASDGPRPFIAMEFVEGETVADLIKKAPFPLTQAVSIAGQVAEALKEAHGKDVVHRDIKSANVMLTPEGIAKVLDFGLAKTNQSTMLTRMGSTLGTVAYMSPEQARGQEVDGRTDLYALGTMLYEMVAGRLPFAGDYEQAVLYSILNETPEPLTALRTGVPMELERIAAKLLSKEAEYRYQSAAGLLADLKSLDVGGSGVSRRSMAAVSAASPVSTAAPRRWNWAAIAAALLVGALAAWFAKPVQEIDRDTTVRSLTLELAGFKSIGDMEPSDDGRTLAFIGTDSTGVRGIHLLNPETRESRLLVTSPVSAPNFSRDGSTVAFWRAGDLYTVPISGGTPVRVAEGAGRSVSWMMDNSIVYVKNAALWVRPSDGSEPRRITGPDSTRIHMLSVLPGDTHVIFCATHPSEPRELLEIVDLKTGTRNEIGYGTRPRYLESGHLLYGDAQTGATGPLYVRPFDLKTAGFTGPEVGLYDNAPVWLYDFDQYGTLYHQLYRVGQDIIPVHSIHAYTPDGGEARRVFSGPGFESVRLSRSDNRIAVTREDGAADWLMIYDPETEVEQQITFSGDEDHHAWSTDGERIMLEKKGPLEIWSTTGEGLLESLPVEGVAEFDWSRDGRLVVYRKRGTHGLGLYDMETDKDTTFEALETYDPRFSPDGKYVAYALEADNQGTIVVRSTAGGTVVRLSLNGRQAYLPVWASDGESIFVLSDADILRIPVEAGDTFAQLGPAEFVLSSPRIREFDIGADGAIYVISEGNVSEDNSGGDAAKIEVIGNWFELIKRLAPPSP